VVSQRQTYSSYGDGYVVSSNLQGMVVLVTGGAQRVGREIVTAVAAAGADVVVSHFNTPADAAETVDRVQALGRRAIAVDADISDPAQATRLVDEAVRGLGRLDVLVHNAGNSMFSDFLDTTVEQFDASFDLFVKGPFFLSQAAARVMMEQGRGKIIALIGNSLYESWPERVSHTIAKSSLARMVECLAVALSPVVQTVGISPAQVLKTESGQNRAAQALRGEETGQEHTLHGGVRFRNGSTEDVTELVTYLCGSTPYLNGAVIPLDGGKHLL
jgi:NAD(P)-dependent dehydrogenase (short-subunit alcohol dehydrogenase family)